MGKVTNIEKIFPINNIENGMIIAKNGSYSLAYEVTLPSVYSLSKHDIEQINLIVDKVIRSLPPNTILQKQDYFFSKKITDPVTESADFLSRGDNRFFYERPVMEHRCYLFITKQIKEKGDPFGVLKSSKQFNDHIAKEGLFHNAVETALSFLEKGGYFTVKQLEDDEITRVLTTYFSLSENETDELGDVVLDKQLMVNGSFAEIFAITSNEDLPLQISTEIKRAEFSTQKTDFYVPFIQPICLDIDFNHLYNQVIYIESSDAIFSVIKRKMNQFRSLATLSKENEVSYGLLEGLVEEVISKEMSFVKQHYSVIIWDKNFNRLQDGVIELKNKFRELNILPYPVTYSMRDIFLANCPGNADRLPDVYKFIGVSSHVSCFLNLESFTGSQKSGALFCNRKNSAPTRIDFWDEPVSRGLIVNRNRLIFGPSGTGKSFLINHIASQYYEQGHHVVMIDIGNSYKKLCLLVKGKYYAYDKDQPLDFNPFYIESLTPEKKEFLTTLIVFLWKEYEKCSREEKQILATYLEAYYKHLELHPGIYPCFSTFYEFVVENKAEEGEERFFDKDSFKISLKEFYSGVYSRILNSENPVNFNEERFIVFELDNIKDHSVLFPLVTMLIIDVIMDKIRNLPGVKKSIFIDECWKPISKGEMVEFIKYLYKTVRKFYGEVAIATQDVEDILDTPAGPAMINNTDTLILLSHKKKTSSLDKFKTFLSFSDADLDKLFSVDRGEVFIKMGDYSNVYKLSVAPERYACYTSSADENKKILDKYNENKNMALSLREFVETKKQ
jgi:conjugation system TraG family ATPase